MKLEERFGAENVFFDNGSLQPGMQWSDQIKSQLTDSAVVIALIGPQWMSSLISRLQTGGEDYVVKEIDLTLRSGPRVTLVPVLVDKTDLPDSSSLPPSLRPLLRCQAERLRLTNLADDIDHLIKCLSQIRDGAGLQGADLHSPRLPQRAPRRPSSTPPRVSCSRTPPRRWRRCRWSPALRPAPPRAREAAGPPSSRSRPPGRPRRRASAGR